METIEYIKDNLKFEALFKDIDKKSKKEIEDYFKAIAISLFNNFILTANGQDYCLAEIEFYYFNKKKHQDPFVYAAIESKNKESHRQQEMGQWYFHYSGIDLTFGNLNHYGGILIRSITNKKGEKIKGPLKLKNHLLNEYHEIGISRDFLKLVFKQNNNNYKKDDIISKQRVNLSKKISNDTFRKKLYNFSI